MRYLGVDYGSKRVGLAISDENAEFALPLSVITNKPLLIKEIIKVATDNAVKEIVIGESRKYDMSANKILPDILALKDSLEKEKFIVHLELEFMSSVQAERLQGKNDMTDASAAAIILQAYLDRKKMEQQ